jgi:glucosamine kinase
MPYYLGIDGGGTKTRFLLGDKAKVLARAATGGSNIVRLGEEQAGEALHTGVRQICDTAQISPAEIRGICIGVAGAGRPGIAEKVRAILASAIPGGGSTKVEVVGDTVIALEAAFGEGPGVIEISGTGSIAFGRDANGHTARAGGWGFAVSDEGSGHWIGRRAVAAILNSRDQDEKTMLTDMILEAWKVGHLDELVQLANAAPPPDFPRLFPVVLRSASKGDAVARNLLVEAGVELARLAYTVIRRLESEGSGPTLPVAMTGSVFRQSADVRQVFYNELQSNFPGIDIRQDLVDPVEGALARAKRL